MRNSIGLFIRALLLSTLAISLGACSNSARAPVNSLELGAVVADLPGTMGKTVDDQRRIDRTVARACGGKILDAKDCDKQTVASAARKKELN